jgi:Ras association domain-containing protein 7/8
MALRQEEWMQKESATVAEIERLRRELDIIRRDTDTMSDMSGSLDQEVQSIEVSLSEKKRQMEKLIAAMKEANLQSLSIQPPDELIEAHHRSGSTRRMIGSPRQLENAAPTSKNPHGVWV